MSIEGKSSESNLAEKLKKPVMDFFSMLQTPRMALPPAS